MCLSPQWIFKTGKRKKTTFRGIENEAYEIGLYAPCGACEECQNKKSNEWLVRNWYEAKAHKKIAFITLTYRESPLFLIKKDGQNFMKRLRRRIEYEFEKTHKAIKGTELYKQLKKEFNEENGIRMFSAGEYGTTRTKRPHLHYIIYNIEDLEAKYLDINKKGNILYKSEIIEKAWGLGRTSYQELKSAAQIAYLSLYETPKEKFKNAYKMSLEKAKFLRKNAHRFITNKKYRKHWNEALKGFEKTLKKEKEKYLAIKEFNTWSQALGFEEFFKEYARENKHTYKCYIEDKEYPIPTSWLKKLANEYGDYEAIEEIKRREEYIPAPSENEKIEALKNQIKRLGKEKKKIKDWNDTKDEQII